MEAATKAAMPAVSFDTAPDRYRHWKLTFDGPVATLSMDVQEDAGLSPDYKLKLNSYDLGVDVELADAIQRLRFEHPEVHAVVITSLKERIFCAGANISIKRLTEIAAAFGVTAADLLREADAAAPPNVVALLGLRGAGKTTIGRQLARRLHARFVELDRQIEKAADMSLAELFSLYGEDYYRRLERDVLQEVLGEARPMVLATGGGLVASPETFAMLRRSAVTFWLRATPEDHWNRVVRQGDRRPMADHPQAMADLRTLLAAREPLYSLADHVIDTSTLPVTEVVDAISQELDERG